MPFFKGLSTCVTWVSQTSTSKSVFGSYPNKQRRHLFLSSVCFIVRWLNHFLGRAMLGKCGIHRKCLPAVVDPSHTSIFKHSVQFTAGGALERKPGTGSCPSSLHSPCLIHIVPDQRKMSWDWVETESGNHPAHLGQFVLLSLLLSSSLSALP